MQTEVGLEVQTENRSTLREKVLKQNDLYKILPFGKTKIQQLIKSNQLPLVKIGNDYITTFNILEDWVRDNIGEEIYY